MIASLPADILIYLFFISACAGLGRRALAALSRRPDDTLLSDILFSAGLGLFILSYAAYALGLAGLVYRPASVALIAAAAWYGRAEIAGFYKRLRAFRAAPLTSREKLLLWVILVAVVFNLLYNYCPPTAEDEIGTHLGIPARWAAAHRIYALPGAVAQYFPLGVLMQHLLLISAASVQTARLFHYISGLLCLASLYMLARRFLGRPTALLASAVFYTMPAVTTLSGVSNTDFLTLFYALLSVHAFLLWRESGDRRLLLLSAVLAGAHVACKYTAFPLMFIASGIVLYYGRDRLAKAAVNAASFLAVSFSALLPYLARNFVLTGNPLYPTKVPGFNYSEMLYLYYLKRDSVPALLKMIARFSSAGDIIWGVGPLFAAFLPFLFVFRLKDGSGRNIGAFMFFVALLNGLLLFAAGTSFQLTRHSILSFALLSIPTAYAAERMLSGEGPRRYVAGLLFLSFAFNLSLPLYFGGKRLPVFLGLQSRQAYFDKGYTIWEGSYFVKYINENVPAGAGVLFLNDLDAPQLNYPRHRVFGMTSVPLALYDMPQDKAEAELKRLGIGYALVVGRSFKADAAGDLYWNRGEGALAVRWLKPGFARVEAQHGGNTLYSLHYSDPPR